MQGFRGLLPRSFLTNQTVIFFIRSHDEYKKLSTAILDMISNIHRIFEINTIQHGKVIDNESTDPLPQPYYQEIASLYSEILNRSKYVFGEASKQINEYSSTVNSSLMSLLHAIQSLQKMIKEYESCEQGIMEIAKKYYKNRKNFLSSIEGYKNSFSEVKLIYNASQKNKRYAQCENAYKNVLEDYEIILVMSQKLTEKKIAIIDHYKFLQHKLTDTYAEMMKNTFNIALTIQDKIWEFLQQFLALLKKAKPQVENIQIRTFFLVSNVEAVSFRQLALPKLFHTSILQQDEVKKQMNLYLKNFEQKVEQQKMYNKKMMDFQFQYFKIYERVYILQMKDMVHAFQRNKKKLKEMFPKKVYEQFSKIKKTTEVFIKSYDQLTKRVNKNIGILGKLLEDQSRSMKMIIKELHQYCEKLNKKDEKYEEKKQFIVHLLTGFKQKININLAQFKRCHGDIINDITLSMKQIESQCRDLFSKREGELFKDQLQGEIQKVLQKRKTIQIQKVQAGKIIFDGEIQKVEDFKKLKKPDLLEIASSSKEKQTTPESLKSMNVGLEQFEDVKPFSPQEEDKSKPTKHKQFLSTKISFVGNEKLLKTFTCALADKIILQGRLYVTNDRLCFHSKFNADNVFFGGTFIEIPKKDIIKLEKKKNGIFFDNSLSITTINGEVFLTSFFKRNKAFDLISKITELHYNDQAFEEEDEVQEQSDEQLQIQADDDIKEEEIPERARQIQEMLAQYDYKECASIDFKFEGMTAFKILKIFYLEEEATINRKKYSSFAFYFKKLIDHSDINIGTWEPNIGNFFNSMNFKNSCPIKASRNVSATIPVVKSPIPFMPKTAKSFEYQTIYLISKHKWILENTIQTSGAPYTDCFKVHYKTTCQSNNEGYCKIASKMFVQFIKNTVMKSIIDSKSQEESALSLSKMYNEYRKHLENLTEKKIRVKKEEVEESDRENPDEKNMKEEKDELEEELDNLRSENEKLKEEIKTKDKKTKYIISAFILLYFLTILAFLL